MPWSTGDKGEGRPGGEHRGLPVQQHGRGQGAAQGHIIHWSQGNQRLKKKLLQGYIFWPSPPPGGEEFLSKLKNREEFGKEKRGITIY